MQYAIKVMKDGRSCRSNCLISLLPVFLANSLLNWITRKFQKFEYPYTLIPKALFGRSCIHATWVADGTQQTSTVIIYI